MKFAFASSSLPNVLPACLITSILLSSVPGHAQVDNSVYGLAAFSKNTSGAFDTAIGDFTLQNNTTGSYNTAIGCFALQNNISGNYNTATGLYSLSYNSAGIENTADGAYALHSSYGGNNNVALGYKALAVSTTGGQNTALGNAALYSSTTGSGNIAIGCTSGYFVTTGSNNIYIGNQGSSVDTETIRIGTNGNQLQTFISGIYGNGSSAGIPVLVDASGKLGTVTSSRRFKFDIKGIGAASDRLIALNPVAFRYKESAPDGSHPQQYGLIAEEVAKVYPDLVAYDKQGKPFTVYYHLLTPLMLNDLQQMHRQLQAQQAKVNSLDATASRQNLQLLAQNTNMALLQHTVAGLTVGMMCMVLAACAVALAFSLQRYGRSRVDQNGAAAASAGIYTGAV